MINLLPFFVIKLLFRLVSYRNYNRRYKGKFRSYSNEFLNQSFKNVKSKIITIQETENIKILYGSNKSKILHDYPVINKRILKEKLKRSNYYKNIKYSHSLKTSGSTGSGLIIPVSLDFLNYKFASIEFFRNLHKIGLDYTTASFSGRVFLPTERKKPPFWLFDFNTNQLILSQYHITNKNVLSYLQALKNYSVVSFHGYPSTLTYFSTLINNEGHIKIAKELNLKFITVGSETLSLAQKKIIESTFNCKVLNFYGQTESVVDIFECEKESMHINEAFSHVELIYNGDGLYRLVGTQLKNKLFPLIRYDTGDLVEYHINDKCSCGRKSRIIRRIIGRDDDYIILNDGRKIGRLDHVFKDSLNIIEAQFIQTEKGESKLQIVKSNSYTDLDELVLIKNIKEKLGLDFEIHIKYVDMIEKTKNGKLKQVINLIND